VPSILSAMGLSAPSRDEPTREKEEDLIRTLIDGWSTVDPEYTLRAARIFGDAARRAAEGWTHLFGEAISGPVEASYTTLEEILPRLLQPAATLSPLSPKLLSWLLGRHLERTLNDVNIARIEQRLQKRGLRPVRPTHPPAVAFVDVSGFTRLTVDRGDDFGARTSVRLGELAEMVMRRHGGRVVKLLGDGVLLRFDSVVDAIEAVLRLVVDIPAAGLPDAHAGIAAGRVVVRDGDVYGRTVNLASRVAAHAGPGQVVVEEGAIVALPAGTGRFEPLGRFTLKGIPDPVALWLARSAHGGD
jgi:adenylate cyclase